MKENPIGIFDSGLGGLTVLKEIAGLLPYENTVYLGDTARVPYGNKSKDTIVRYSFENARFLLRHHIKLLVIACNTASAFALEEIRSALPIPVIGVIEPGAKAATAATRTGRVGIIGTEGTIKSGAYCSAIKALAPDVKTFTQACPLFVPLAEEGWTDNSIAIDTAAAYLAPLKKFGIDTLVLGCTHYPLLKKTIARVMGPGVKLIDSAEAAAQEVRRTLAENDIANSQKSAPSRRFYVTDSPERFIKVGRTFFGKELSDAELAYLEALEYGKEKE
ncbi:MAG: glutamate racemase [Deltaproteobacteria bacterium]|nr:glutamate racemase [Deltaproteobacteria bacterium]